MVPLFDSESPCSDDDTTTCRKNKGQVFFEWANRIDRNHDDVSILGSGDQMYVALYLGYVGRILQVQGELSRLLLVFFVRANRIAQGQGDVGYGDDVSVLGSMTSASKGNCHMAGNTPLWNNMLSLPSLRQSL